MRAFRRVTQRVAPLVFAAVSVASLASCDLDKVSKTPEPITGPQLQAIFNITGDSLVTLGGTLDLGINSASDLTHTLQRWSSTASTIAPVDSVTGVVSGLAIGSATITARLLAPELDTGYSQKRIVRVRYKAIVITAIDSLTQLGQSRAVVVRGTNNANAAVAAVTPVLTGGLSGTDTVFRVSGSNIIARKAGTATLTATFDNFTAQIAVKVRQIAKSIIFPATEYVANSLNANRSFSVTVKDAADSLIVTPTLRWRAADTSLIAIDSVTGVFRVKSLTPTSIIVRADTVIRSQPVRVQQVVASLTKFSGDARSDTVAQVVTVLPTVTAVDSGGSPVSGATVTFAVASGAGTITGGTATTAANGRASVGSWKLGNVATAQTLTATSGTATTTFSVTGLPQRPAKLLFSVHPSSATVGTNITPAVRVSIQDTLNNIVSTATDSITVAFGNNSTGATLNGTKKVAAVAGVGIFSTLNVSALGSAYTLAATSGTLANAISNAFDIFGAASKLAFSVQPSNVTVGAPMTPSVRVLVQDAANNTVTTATDSIRLTIATNPGTATLGGTVAARAVAGVAVFNNVTLSAAANGYTLQAATVGSTLTSVTSTTFNVTPVGTAKQLAFVQQPPTTTSAGTTFTPPVTVVVQDSVGAPVTNSTVFIALSIDPTANPGNPGTTTGLSGNTSGSASAGTATFNSINIPKVGTSYKLRATATGLTSASSSPITITAGTPVKLGFIQGPTHTESGQIMAPAVTVAVQDANNNTVSTVAATPITLALSGVGCTASALSGGGSTNTSNGVASFSNLTISQQLSGCTLVASTTGGTYTSATSTTFNSVAATGAVKLGFVAHPSTAGAGVSLGNIQVTLQDKNGSTVTGASAQVTLAIGNNAAGNGVLSGGTNPQNTASGSVLFSGMSISQTGTGYTLTASAVGYPTVTSNAFNITAGTATTLGFLQEPTSTDAGVPFASPIRIAIQDNLGNTVTTATNNIFLLLSTFPTGATIEGVTMPVTPVNGVADFTGVRLKKAGTYQLRACTVANCSTGFSRFSNGTFEVRAGPPTSLSFSSQPFTSVNAAQDIGTINVSVSDSVGNASPNASNSITLALSGGDPAATLSGTKTLASSAGTASFTGLTIDKPGTYRLNASASGFATSQSSQFTVTRGPSTKLVFLDQPTNRTGGQPFSPTLRVAITDAAGNIVTNAFDRNVTLTIGADPGATGAAVMGQSSVFSSAGIATFDGVAVDKVGNGYQLTATECCGLTNATSNAFDVTIGTKSKVTFKQQPTNALGGATLTPSVTVGVTDDGGNVITSATDNVTVAITQFTGAFGAALSGTKVKAAVAGIATFDNLSIDKASNGYRLTATGDNLAGSESNNFNINVGPAAKLVVSGEPSSTQSGSTFNLSVSITDQAGNTVNTISNVTLSVGSGPSGGAVTSAAGLTKQTSGGNAFWSDLKLDKAGIYQIRASSGTLTAGNSQNITVDPGQATKLAWLSQPQNTFLNAPLNPSGSGSQPQIILQDAAGNTATTSFATVRLAIASAPGGVSLLNNGNDCTANPNFGFCDFNTSGGVVTLPTTVTFSTAGTPISLNASAPNQSLAAVSSSTFDVAAFGSKAKLSFTVQPGVSVPAGLLTVINPAVRVAIQDQWDNVITNASDQISLAIANDPNGVGVTTLANGGPVTPTNGVAAFFPYLDRTGSGFTLRATGATFNATSASFSVTSPGVVVYQNSLSNQIADMARSGTDLFYIERSSNGSLTKVSNVGGARTVLVTGLLNPVHVATDGNFVYWIEQGDGSIGSGAVKKIAVTGAGGITTLVGGLNDVPEYTGSFGLDGSNVWFLARSNIDGRTAIKKIAIGSSGGTATDVVFGSCSGCLNKFTVSGGFLYYYDTQLGNLSRIPTGGGSPTVLASGTSAWDLTVLGSTLYFVEGNSLKSVPITGGSVTPRITSTSSFYYNLTNDGTNLYAQVDGVIRRINVSDFSNPSLANGGFTYATLIIDGTSVYYYSSSGRLEKAPK